VCIFLFPSISFRNGTLLPWYDFSVPAIFGHLSLSIPGGLPLFPNDPYPLVEFNTSTILLMTYTPIHFINEQIEVEYKSPPTLEKKPGCPDGFTWRNFTYCISEVLSEWHDYDRKGRMARNMKPANARKAKVRGSWGVGQDYYRVRTEQNQIFEIYYDRAPQNVSRRKGAWFIYRELVEDPSQ